MKKFRYKYSLPMLISTLVLVYACSKNFTDIVPAGSISPSVLANKNGVSGLLVGAYAMLDGSSGAGNSNGNWANASSNWVYGSVIGDDARKGSDPGDQPAITPLENWNANAANTYLNDVWSARFDGVQRANDVLRTMRLATDMTTEDTVQAAAEARFLRGHYHFDLKKIFGKIPFVDEGITYSLNNWRVSNSADAWPLIEADFQYAYDNLPETQSQIGRANKWAAAAFLAKAYMFQKKYAAALPILNAIMTNGKTSGGAKYALTANFADNFNPAKKNSAESVFAVQSSINDGSGAGNANPGDVLNFPYGGGPGTCCGFFQPSISLVNAYKVDGNGLPLFTTYNNSDLKNDQGISSDAPYTADNTTPVDPRLDWSVGRRGIPYLDWGLMPGQSWIRNQGSAGPFIAIKNVYYKSQEGVLTDNSSWTSGYTANNVNLIRYADVLLWAAECEVEVGSLDNAQALVNQVRNRNTAPSTWVQGSVANYKIGLYPAGTFTTQGQAYARTAVRFERRLELAMEGHRFFDLARYEPGVAATELNAFAAHELASGYTLKVGAVFTAGKNEVLPIPQQQIDLSSVDGSPTLSQNPGY